MSNSNGPACEEIGRWLGEFASYPDDALADRGRIVNELGVRLTALVNELNEEEREHEKTLAIMEAACDRADEAEAALKRSQFMARYWQIRADDYWRDFQGQMRRVEKAELMLDAVVALIRERDAVYDTEPMSDLGHIRAIALDELRKVISERAGR